MRPSPQPTSRIAIRKPHPTACLKGPPNNRANNNQTPRHHGNLNNDFVLHGPAREAAAAEARQAAAGERAVHAGVRGHRVGAGGGPRGAGGRHQAAAGPQLEPAARADRQEALLEDAAAADGDYRGRAGAL